MDWLIEWAWLNGLTEWTRLNGLIDWVNLTEWTDWLSELDWMDWLIEWTQLNGLTDLVNLTEWTDWLSELDWMGWLIDWTLLNGLMEWKLLNELTDPRKNTVGSKVASLQQPTSVTPLLAESLASRGPPEGRWCYVCWVKSVSMAAAAVFCNIRFWILQAFCRICIHAFAWWLRGGNYLPRRWIFRQVDVHPPLRQ